MCLSLKTPPLDLTLFVLLCLMFVFPCQVSLQSVSYVDMYRIVFNFVDRIYRCVNDSIISNLSSSLRLPLSFPYHISNSLDNPINYALVRIVIVSLK